MNLASREAPAAPAASTLPSREPAGPRAVVVGAGLIGTCTAHALRQAGFRVTVVEAREDVALETSFANAGRFCPTLVSTYPLTGPKTVTKMLTPEALRGFLFSSSSSSLTAETKASAAPGDAVHDPDATTIKTTGSLPSSVELSLDIVRWGAHFLRFCTRARSDANNAVFRRLAHLCQDSTAALVAEFPGQGASVDLRSDNVWVYGSQSALGDAVHRAQKASGAGFKHWKELSSEACISTYPFLESYFDKMLAQGMEPSCVAALDDYTADARKFTAQVRRLCEQKGAFAPVSFHFGQRVRSIAESAAGGPRGRVLRISISPDAEGAVPTTLEAEHVVLCCGPSTNAVHRELGLPPLPIVGLRGASIDLHGVEFGPRAGIADYVSGGMGFQLTPLADGTVRLAGFADLVGENAAPPSDEKLERYGAALKARARLLFPHLTWTDERKTWSGVRPMTPDSLPLIGRAPGPVANVWVNAGHGPVGWTMAAGTARILAHQLAQAEGLDYASAKDLARYGLDQADAFSPARFSFFGGGADRQT